MNDLVLTPLDDGGLRIDVVDSTDPRRRSVYGLSLVPGRVEALLDQLKAAALDCRRLRREADRRDRQRLQDERDALAARLAAIDLRLAETQA